MEKKFIMLVGVKWIEIVLYMKEYFSFWVYGLRMDDCKTHSLTPATFDECLMMKRLR
jgi:phage replication-related protein YjqB (UPF0714/DUF867 family)